MKYMQNQLAVVIPHKYLMDVLKTNKTRPSTVPLVGSVYEMKAWVLSTRGSSATGQSYNTFRMELPELKTNKQTYTQSDRGP